MATRKTTAAPKSAPKSTPKSAPKSAPKADEATVKEEVVAVVSEPVEQEPQHKTIQKSFNYADIDTRETIVVRNGFHGVLVYESPRTHEVFKWSEFGDEQEMEIAELRTAKNNYKQFFMNNWFLFDDDYAWIVDYLGVGAYYKHTLNVDRLIELFDLPEAELKREVAALTDNQKLSIAYIARELRDEKRLDSITKVEAIEAAIGMSLSDD